MASEQVTKAVIPAAGRGTRLLPATRSQPKEMLLLGRKPCIQYVVEELAAAGITDILIVTGKDKRAIEDHFDYGNSASEGASGVSSAPADLFSALGHVNIFYIRQNQPRGTAHAVSLAKTFTEDEPFVVAFGDVIFHSPRCGSLVTRLLSTRQTKSASATIAVREVEAQHVSRYDIVAPRSEVRDDGFEIAGVIEKPKTHNAPSRWAFTARCVFGPEIFDAVRAIKPADNGELQLTDAIQWLAEEGHGVWAVPLTQGETRYDVGNFESYFLGFVEMALNDEEVGSEVLRLLTRHVQKARLGEEPPLE